MLASQSGNHSFFESVSQSVSQSVSHCARVSVSQFVRSPSIVVSLIVQPKGLEVDVARRASLKRSHRPIKPYHIVQSPSSSSSSSSSTDKVRVSASIKVSTRTRVHDKPLFTTTVTMNVINDNNHSTHNVPKVCGNLRERWRGLAVVVPPLPLLAI